jgi:hypothetical protein
VRPSDLPTEGTHHARALRGTEPDTTAEALPEQATASQIVRLEVAIMADIAWESDLDAACQRAHDEGKFVLLDFFSPM